MILTKKMSFAIILCENMEVFLMKTQHLKRAIFLFSIIAFLISSFGVLGIVMIDNKDFFGSQLYGKNLFSELISAFRIERINVSFLSLLAFCLIYVSTLFLIETLFIGIWSLLIDFQFYL